MTGLEGETAIVGLIATSVIPWALIARGVLRTAGPVRRPGRGAAAGTVAGAVAAPATVPAAAAPDRIRYPHVAPDGSAARPKNRKLSAYASARPRNEHGAFLPVSRAS